MKGLIKIIGVIIVAVLLTSCVAYVDEGRGNGNRLPPGQAKKIYGGSAKDYAPGQVKKRNGY
ncbi:quinol oxidase subunit 4 [Chryseobacterium sp. PMSZPI]|uniref:quinol oxidase subunit 4 n=1 Tax=Chryseobacterium sp. PMSZPI TaxID=1033900 RepID=UPI000C33B791|nr:quinol oxidase subunit 4 [Chryseobacterium sp. PMSZPI]PKF75918.1 quinol oxidase subunit 4 [Chryseobacterium sp. PMSZPI]